MIETIQKAWKSKQNSKFTRLFKASRRSRGASLLGSQFTKHEFIRALIILACALVLVIFLYNRISWRWAQIKNERLKTTIHYGSLFLYCTGWIMLLVKAVILKTFTTSLRRFQYSNLLIIAKYALILIVVLCIISLVFYLIVAVLQHGKSFEMLFALLISTIFTYATYFIYMVFIRHSMGPWAICILFAFFFAVFYFYFYYFYNLLGDASYVFHILRENSFLICSFILIMAITEYFQLRVVRTLIKTEIFQKSIRENIYTAVSGLSGDSWKCFLMAFFTSWTRSIIRSFNTITLSAFLSEKIKNSDIPETEKSNMTIWKNSLKYSASRLACISYFTLFPEICNLFVLVLGYAANMLNYLHTADVSRIFSNFIDCYKGVLCSLSFLINCSNHKYFSISSYKAMHVNHTPTAQESSEMQMFSDRSRKDENYVIFLANLPTLSAPVFEKSPFVILPILFTVVDRYASSVIKNNIFIISVIFEVLRQIIYLISTLVIIEKQHRTKNMNS